MKKFIVILTVFFLAFFLNNCEENESLEQEPLVYQPKEVQKFLDSEDFKKNECLFENYGQIGIGKFERFQILGDSAYQLMIPILDWFNKGIITAYLQVIELPEGELPDKGVYFMNLIDLTRGFDTGALTGNVAMFGVNYKVGINDEAFKHCELTIKKNIIVSSEYFSLPEEYMQEMTAKCKLRDFLSCYRHTRQAFNDDDVLFFVCDVADMVMPACSMAAAAYCISH
jgi:hypothetical protein